MRRDDSPVALVATADGALPEDAEQRAAYLGTMKTAGTAGEWVVDESEIEEALPMSDVALLPAHRRRSPGPARLRARDIARGVHRRCCGTETVGSSTKRTPPDLRRNLGRFRAGGASFARARRWARGGGGGPGFARTAPKLDTPARSL
jgi:hypothetical protein